jgi:hypothetical protein
MSLVTWCPQVQPSHIWSHMRCMTPPHTPLPHMYTRSLLNAHQPAPYGRQTANSAKTQLCQHPPRRGSSWSMQPEKLPEWQM